MEKNKIALIVNTISKNSDIWKCFFDRIEQHTTLNFFDKKYIFVDDGLSKIPKDYEVLNYDKRLTYKQQFCSCIQGVKEEYCIYISEDYILYKNVDEAKINHFKKILNEDSSLSFIRFMRGGVYDGPFQKYSDNLSYVPENKQYSCSFQWILYISRIYYFFFI